MTKTILSCVFCVIVLFCGSLPADELTVTVGGVELHRVEKRDNPQWHSLVEYYAVNTNDYDVKVMVSIPTAINVRFELLNDYIVVKAGERYYMGYVRGYWSTEDTQHQPVLWVMPVNQEFKGP